MAERNTLVDETLSSSERASRVVAEFRSDKDNFPWDELEKRIAEEIEMAENVLVDLTLTRRKAMLLLDKWGLVDSSEVTPRQEVLLFCGTVRRIGYWDPAREEWISQNGRTILHPTHLAALLPAPKKKKKRCLSRISKEEAYHEQN